MSFLGGSVCVARRRGDPPGASRRAMRDIGRAAQRSGRPPARNPFGPGDFASWVRRTPRPYSPVRASSFSCPRRKIPSAQAVPPKKDVLRAMTLVPQYDPPAIVWRRRRSLEVKPSREGWSSYALRHRAGRCRALAEQAEKLARSADEERK